MMEMRTLSAMAFALVLGVAAPAAAQIAPLTDQSFMSVTIVGNVEANKALGWL